MHRSLLYGGIFMYPADRDNPRGKLRLLYEAAPMAMIVEHAGGSAIDGEKNILDIEPTDLHERSPLYVGSRECVEMARRFLMADGASQDPPIVAA